jgi:hypothetical protein
VALVGVCEVQGYVLHAVRPCSMLMHMRLNSYSVLTYTTYETRNKPSSLVNTCRFLGIQLVIVLNQNVVLQQQQQLQLQAACNVQEGSAVRLTSSASGGTTPLRKHSSGPLATHKVITSTNERNMACQSFFILIMTVH